MSIKQEKASGKGGKIAIIVGTVIALIIIVVLVGIIIYLKNSEEKEPEKRNVVITPENVEEVIQQMEEIEYVEPGYYTVMMNYNWHFTDGGAVSDNAYVENIQGNTNDVYFDVFLAGDETQAIYKSPVIPIGSRLRQITLDTKLDAGVYDCVVVYHLVDEEQNTISTLRLTLTIQIDK